MPRWLLVVLGGVILLGVGFIGLREKVPAPSSGAAGLRVVTTTPVLYSLTAQVLGTTEGLTNLVPPGASPENSALTPHGARALAEANVLVMVGFNFERFLESAIAGVRERGATVIVASEGIVTRPAILEEPGAEVEPGAVDPHVWTDPPRAVQMARNIAEGLAQGDPVHASRYRAHAGDIAGRLTILDTDIRAQLSHVQDRRFIAFHPAWGYFAERYNLEQVAVVEDTVGVEPTAQEIAELREHVEETGVRALISEPQFSPRIVAALARDLGLHVVEANVEGGELQSDGYEGMMRANAAAFATALGARSQ